MDKVVVDLLKPFDIDPESIKKMDGYGSFNYHVVSKTGEHFVLKHYTNRDQYELIREESEIVNSIRTQLPYQVSHSLERNETIIYQYPDGSFSRIHPFLKGTFLAEVNITPELLFDLGRSIALMTDKMSSCKALHFKSKRDVWDLKFALDNRPLISEIKEPERRKLVHYFLDRFEHFAFTDLLSLPFQLIHNDFNDWNVLCTGDKISGVIDFGDATYSPKICELAIGLAYVMMNKKLPLAVLSEVVRGYCSVCTISEKEANVLPDLIATRLCTSVCHSAKAKNLSDDTEYILISEKGAWDLLEKWIKWNPILLKNAIRESAGLPLDKSEDSNQENALKRENYFSPALGLSYKSPIHMSSAAFQYMHDTKGNTYLDAYNNIPLVGHCHPKISEAVSRQVRLLNTNTRYHNDSLYKYAEELLSLFPSHLNKVFFVNSGTEANDLAQRLANNYTSASQNIVVEMGYHGHSEGLINLSAYKYSRAGGKGKNDHVLEVALPKEFNGKYQSCEEYLNEAQEQISASISNGAQYSNFLVEPISGCGGQVPLISGYLKNIVPWLRKRGVLTISDEVQIGFGRLGKWNWGFEMQEYIPDIVVLGKPMGNGFPLAGVVTTTEIADAFNNGMEYFSSFGGNPISTEVGRAVLNVVKEEGLKQNALKTGDYFKAQLEQLKEGFECIGDIRGEGLFIGIEFVSQNDKHAGIICLEVKNRLKQNYVLTGSDGRHDETMKIKPPLCFNSSNVDEVIDKMEKILRSM